MKKLPILLSFVFTFSLSLFPAENDLLSSELPEVVLSSQYRSKTVIVHKVGDFKHAVARYIRNADHKLQRAADENSAYKKELRYLFKNYERFSAATLLYRLRLAHQEMLKDATIEDESYKKYEQISSALLLVCSQIFFSDVRNQILVALHEIDNLIAYWRYQQHHQIRYFFSKSPSKWLFGKSQSKEIAHNMIKLERKQRELYTLLGALTEHVHAFGEIGMTYENCYRWIEQLMRMTSCIKKSKKSSRETSDGSRFDEIATQLYDKLKRIGSFKYDCMRSIWSAHKPNHVVQHWIAYTTALAASAYAAHFYVNNSALVNGTIYSNLTSLHESWTEFAIKPSKDLWQTVFGKVEQQKIDTSAADLVKDIKDLEVNYGINKKTSEDLTNYLKKDRKNTQDAMQKLLDRLLSEKTITQEDYQKMIDGEKVGDITPFQEFFLKMDAYLYKDLINKQDFIQAVKVLAELKIYHYGTSLIDIVFELIVHYGIPVVKELLIVLAKGNQEWASVYKKVNLILNVAVLTPTIIVGLVGCGGLYKTYQWAAKRDYSPIRTALTDINSLLIETVNNLDDHDYGKLVYLVFKLKHRAVSLKDPLSNEFLGDVAKLESKKYSAQTKRAIVENMFNKYAFLGRVAA